MTKVHAGNITPTNSVQVTKTVIPKPIVKTTMTESEMYKLLYENSKENNDKLTSSIQWVIGISIAFLLAIFGSQIFFNWRINKKEIDFIKKDIEEKIGELKAGIIKDITSSNKERDNDFKEMFEKLEKEFKEKITEQFEEKSKLIELTDKIKEKDFEFLRKELDNKLKSVKASVEKNSGDLWLLKGVESNALSSFSRTAILQLELNSDIKYILDDIIKVLDKLIELNIYDYEKLDELLEKMGTKYPEKKRKIESLYKNKPIYKFTERPGQGLIDSIGLNRLLGVRTKEYVKNGPEEK